MKRRKKRYKFEMVWENGHWKGIASCVKCGKVLDFEQYHPQAIVDVENARSRVLGRVRRKEEKYPHDPYCM